VSDALAGFVKTLSIERKSFERVLDGWLNDESINAILCRLQAHLLALGIKVKLFQTFFYMYLLRGDSVDEMRRKLKGDVLSGYDTVLLVVNIKGVHWGLVEVDLRSRRVSYIDSQGGRGGLELVRTSLRLLPSSRLTLVAIQRTVLKWIKAETAGWPGFEDAEWTTARKESPEQLDGNSCGLFAIMNAACIALGKQASFTQADMPVIRRFLAAVCLGLASFA